MKRLRFFKTPNTLESVCKILHEGFDAAAKEEPKAEPISQSADSNIVIEKEIGEQDKTPPILQRIF